MMGPCSRAGPFRLAETLRREVERYGKLGDQRDGFQEKPLVVRMWNRQRRVMRIVTGQRLVDRDRPVGICVRDTVAEIFLILLFAQNMLRDFVEPDLSFFNGHPPCVVGMNDDLCRYVQPQQGTSLGDAFLDRVQKPRVSDLVFHALAVLLAGSIAADDD